MGLCDQLEQEIQSSQSTREDWMKSPLRSAFAKTPADQVMNDLSVKSGVLGMAAEPGGEYKKKK
jgi:hypothetical protein